MNGTIAPCLSGDRDLPYHMSWDAGLRGHGNLSEPGHFLPLHLRRFLRTEQSVVADSFHYLNRTKLNPISGLICLVVTIAAPSFYSLCVLRVSSPKF